MTLAQRVAAPAPGAELPDPERWSDALGVAVEHGAAWRWAQGRDKPRLQLLQGEFAAGGSGGAWRENLRRPALLAAALVVVASVGIAADWALKSAERDRLQAEMAAIYRESFGEGAVLVDPPLQMSRALAELRLRAGQGSASDFVPLLGAVAEKLPDPAVQRVESVDYEDGRLTLALRARDPKQAAAVAAQLRANSAVPGVDIRVEETGAGALRLTASVRGSK